LIQDVLANAPDVLKPNGEVHIGVTGSLNAKGLRQLGTYRSRALHPSNSSQGSVKIGERSYRLELVDIRQGQSYPYSEPYNVRRSTGGRLRNSRSPVRYYIFKLISEE
jgi:hypothetical protein